MTPDQRQRVRKLHDKLCTKAVGYKCVYEQECAVCESPCGYGVEMLSCVGLEPPKRWKERDGSGEIRPVGRRSTRRVVRAMNRGKPG